MAKKGESPRKVADVLMEKVKKAMVEALQESCLLVEGTAKELCPVDQGPLRASITYEVDKDTLQGTVFTNVEYAPMVEYGTRAHIIEPKDKSVLRFEVGKKSRLSAGKGGPNIVFSKRVHHPGTSASPFMRNSLDLNRDNIKRIFAYKINKFGKK